MTTVSSFMDLGFVFSKEDVNSRLVEIILGLQRLKGEKNRGLIAKKGKNRGLVVRKGKNRRLVVVNLQFRGLIFLRHGRFGRERREKPLMNWRFPDVNNETGMKDSLKWWAHTIALTVR
ncbi:uncharacterized protein LOC130753636 [Actinidia eriantha]|uniref:uncharacterized protein LOC130753636 n=1 Tax=Actinidia eriantha TaxID=165200 RepID=UPI00258EF914|nr:uncharacterized protein LOC130753636 [Actinidia eriantha]